MSECGWHRRAHADQIATKEAHSGSPCVHVEPTGACDRKNRKPAQNRSLARFRRVEAQFQPRGLQQCAW